MWLARVRLCSEALALAAVAAIVCGGCVLGGASVDDAAAAAGLRTLLVLPTNFDATPPAELVRGVDVVEAEVEHYLRANGHELRSVPLPELILHWRAALSQRGSLIGDDPRKLQQEQYEQARSALVRRLVAMAPADAVVMPTLVVREGLFQGTDLSWDGVSRRVDVVVGPADRMGVRRIGGKSTGSSLRVSVFLPDGRELFERHGGLEVLVRWFFIDDRVRGETRSDLFEDPAIIEQAVRIAFEPLMAASDERRR